MTAAALPSCKIIDLVLIGWMGLLRTRHHRLNPSLLRHA